MTSSDFEKPTSLVRVPRAQRELVVGGAAQDEPRTRRLVLRDYFEILRRHAGVVLGIIALFTIPIVILTALSRDFYLATARIELSMERPAAATDSSGVSQFVSIDPAYFNTQLQLLSSPALLRRVIKDLDLEHNELFISRMTKGGRMIRYMMRLGFMARSDANVAVPPAATPGEIAEAERLAPFVEDLQGRLQVDPVLETRTGFRDTRLVDITFKHSSPVLTARIVNAIADAFVTMNLEKNRQSGASANLYLTRRTMELQEQVREAEQKLIEYSRSHQILSLEPGQNVAVDRLASLNRQLLEAENDRKLAEANYHEAEKIESASAIADERVSAMVAQSQIRLFELRAKRAQLLVGATEKWPEVQEVNQQILAIENDMVAAKSQAAASAVASLETRYRQAVAHEEALRGDFAAQRSMIQAQNEAAVNYRLIQQEIITTKDLLSQALKRLGENDLALAAVGNNVRTVDYAITPDPSEPAGPWRLLFIGFALFLSLVVAAGVVLAREYMDESVRSSMDVEIALQLPTIGVIRAAERKKSMLGAAQRAPFMLKPRVAGRNGSNGSNGHHPELLINGSSAADLAEDYRRLRTAVLFPVNGDSPKTLLVASSQRHEGRTTTAVNVASSLAQLGSNTLLIDADLRQPGIHAAFGFDNSVGLSTILSTTPTEEQVLSMIRLHPLSGVHVLTAGPVPRNPAELLGSFQMGQLLDTLRRTFTYIVVDSAAVGSCTDAVVLSAHTDGVLMVVRASTTSRESVRTTRQLLTRVGAPILGVVLNQVDSAEHGFSARPAREASGLDAAD